MFQVFLALAVDYVKDNLKNLQYKLKYKDIQKIIVFLVYLPNIQLFFEYLYILIYTANSSSYLLHNQPLMQKIT
jgi:hypothetical protein